MRVQALLLAVFLGVALPGLTDALCDLVNVNEASCNDLEDVKHIEAQNLTLLKAHVLEKTLTSVPFKKFSFSLKRLDLSTGDLQFIESGAFAKLTNLLDLKLADNSIAQFKDDAFDGLKSLKNLDLRRNDIQHLSAAFTKLPALRNLEVSENPIACNCATLRIRDELLAREVKISKKVFCVTPSHLKGISLLEPEAEVICMFEEQDAEMQADQTIGSGDGADTIHDEGITDIPHIEDVLITDSQVPDAVDNGAKVISDDLIFPSNTSLPGVTENRDDQEDFGFEKNDYDDGLIVEGSGALLRGEEGSGWEGSGIGEFLPSINPRVLLVEETPEPSTTTTEPSTTTTELPTTTEKSWLDVIWNTITGDSDSSTPRAETEPEEDVTDEQFIPAVTSEQSSILETDTSEGSTTMGSFISNKGFLPEFNREPVEEEVVTKSNTDLEGAARPESTSESTSTSKSNKMLEDFSDTTEKEDTAVDDLGEASTHQSKKSMGSYVVLAALLGVLAALIGFAAYKSTFCKKKPNNDPEQGSELKDMRKALLENNSVNQAKISSNGNAENAPLVEEKQGSWAEPQDVKRWPDSTSNPILDNGAKYSPPGVESEPIKPPRKSLPPQEDANGLQEVKTHAPMSTFAPKTPVVAPGSSNTPPNSPSSPTEERRSPPLSPGTQRVKITLQENPDSIPKTPILITRTKPGVNLVKTP